MRLIYFPLLAILFAITFSLGFPNFSSALEQTAIRQTNIDTGTTQSDVPKGFSYLVKCEKKGKFYDPTAPGVDADGCIGPTLPSCASGLVLTVSGGNFACTDPVPDCPAGSVLISNGGGGWECGCQSPFGGYIRDGGSIQAYETGSVACTGVCKRQTRTCSNGILSGSYTNQNCTTGSCSCTLPWGGSIPSGSSVYAYQTPSVACNGTCLRETRTCTNTTLSGSFVNQACTTAACPPKPCSLPWGGQINNGESVTAYQASSVACGSGCTSQTRTCTDGVLSGSYTNASCTTQACLACALPWGGSIAHGQRVLAYQRASEACGGSCTKQWRTCNNGSLSGNYRNRTCSVAACKWAQVCRGPQSCQVGARLGGGSSGYNMAGKVCPSSGSRGWTSLNRIYYGWRCQ